MNVMTRFFPGVDTQIPFEGKDTKNPLAFKYNMEANHATLAGNSFEHELVVASAPED